MGSRMSPVPDNGTGFTAGAQCYQQGHDGLCLPQSSELLMGCNNHS